jgi:DNA modification methylase
MEKKELFILHRKPLELIKDLIEKHSMVDGLVSDTFGGSGTTATRFS